MQNLIRPVVIVLVALLAFAFGSPLRADVVVVANRTTDRVVFQAVPASGPLQKVVIEVADLVTLPTQGPLTIRFAGPDGEVEYDLQANSIYYFRRTDERGLDIYNLALGDARRQPPAGNDSPEVADPKPPGPFVVPVKILVDDNERATRQVWETRIRKRVEAASAILEKYCRVRFQVVASGTWNSDEEISELEPVLREFERQVPVDGFRLAIGFTAQKMRATESHLGGTGGSLRSHILVQEWASGVSEAERLELLVHELGHFLGAAHSPEPSSVMRPILADWQARSRNFSIGLDPLNAMAMCLVAEELGRREVRSAADLSEETRDQLRAIYRILDEVFPADPAARTMHRLLLPDKVEMPTDDGTRRVLQAIYDEAQRLALLGTAPTGDMVTDRLVRHAAREAARLPKPSRHKSFVLAVSIALGDATRIAGAIPGANLANSMELQDASGRRRKLPTLPLSPTIAGRRDLAQHFFVSALLTVAVGSRAAAAAGHAKELLDARGGSGYSFADLAADHAGIRFAAAILEDQRPLEDLALDFSWSDFMPAIDGLREGLAWDDFVQEYGNEDNQAYRRQLDDIVRRIELLPGHRGRTPSRPAPPESEEPESEEPELAPKGRP